MLRTLDMTQTMV